MAVPFLPSVTDRIICSSVSCCLDFSEVKFFGGGFNTFAAKVLPSPLFPWQALQCLKKMSRPVSESTGSAKAIEAENKHTSKPRHQLFNLINPPHSPLIRGEVLSKNVTANSTINPHPPLSGGRFYQANIISRSETVIVRLKTL